MSETTNSTPQASDKVLVVVLHGYTYSPRHMAGVVKVIGSRISNARFLEPKLPLNTFSMIDPVRIARLVIGFIDQEIAHRIAKDWEPFEEIILVGHSCGALLARKLYVLAGPESPEAPFEDSRTGELSAPKPWFGLVRRIVLVAGMNRGWSFTHHLSLGRMVALKVGTAFGDVVMALTGRAFMISRLRRGAPFITELRLQWLALSKNLAARGQQLALTIQLLGTVDDLVAPNDNIDLVTGRDFIYLDVPYSGHADVIAMDDPKVGRLRAQVLEQAVCEDKEALSRRNLVPQDIGLFDVREHVSDVIFVLHGIRDVGYWTQKIARKIEALGNAPPKIYGSETSSYGYFAMFPFLLPSRRREKVEWLMDRYVEAKSLYPDARFSFVGHSNGTYLLAKALKEYRGCRFHRIVFAGSVVRTDYNWTSAIMRGQVEAVLNFVGTRDFVVACFPGAMEVLNIQDLGRAGHLGFRDKSPLLFQSRIPGGHGAALSEENWDNIARFIVERHPPLVTSNNGAVPQSWMARLLEGLARTLGTVAPLVWLVIACGVALLGTAIWTIHAREAVRTVALLLYVWLVWRILTRV